jgi:hypothetical protein
MRPKAISFLMVFTLVLGAASAVHAAELSSQDRHAAQHEAARPTKKVEPTPPQRLDSGWPNERGLLDEASHLVVGETLKPSQSQLGPAISDSERTR